MLSPKPVKLLDGLSNRDLIKKGSVTRRYLSLCMLSPKPLKLLDGLSNRDLIKKGSVTRRYLSLCMPSPKPLKLLDGLSNRDLDAECGMFSHNCLVCRFATMVRQLL
jgi:hypothetical protein